MRVAISQPMKGLSAEEIRKQRAVVVASLEAEGHEVVDTVFTGTPPESGSQALWHLGKALQTLSTVDAVYFMDGWDQARGCRIEYEACVFYGKTAMNAEWQELKRAFSVERTLFECFPDQMNDPRETVEQVANRIIRLCRIKCDDNKQSWEMYKNLRKKIERMRLAILALSGLLVLIVLYSTL